MRTTTRKRDLQRAELVESSRGQQYIHHFSSRMRSVYKGRGMAPKHNRSLKTKHSGMNVISYQASGMFYPVCLRAFLVISRRSNRTSISFWRVEDCRRLIRVHQESCQKHRALPFYDKLLQAVFLLRS